MLEKVMFAMRKLDMMELDVLCTQSPETLRRVQNVFILCGYNFYTHVPAEIMGFARRVKYEFRGRIPTDAYTLCSFLGISRKICMLILQDAFTDDRKYSLELKREPLSGGIVCDRHVLAFSVNFGLTRFRDLDKAGMDMESWLPRGLWRQFNESVGGIRQLYANAENVERMETIAGSLGELSFLKRLVLQMPAKSGV